MRNRARPCCCEEEMTLKPRRQSMSTACCRTVQHIVLALLCCALPLFAQSGPTTIRHDVHHDVSLPLSEMIKHAPPPSLARRRVEPMRRIPLPPGLEAVQQDPVIQVGTVAPATPPVTLGFEGLGNGQYGFSVTGAPPDTEGTVGATQYVQWVNTSFADLQQINRRVDRRADCRQHAVVGLWRGLPDQ